MFANRRKHTTCRLGHPQCLLQLEIRPRSSIVDSAGAHDAFEYCINSRKLVETLEMEIWTRGIKGRTEFA